MNELPFYYKNLFSKLHGLIITKNLDSTVTSVNKNVLDILKIKQNEILNKSYDDMPFLSEGFAEKLKKQDEFVINSKNNIEYFSIGMLKSLKSSIFRSSKFPLFDSENNVIGLAVHSIVVKEQSIIEKIASLKNYDLKRYKNIYGHYYSCEQVLDVLTEKEKEVIFYLIRGKTASDIAGILSRSIRTIEAHINNIKYKLSVSSKSQLIEFIIENGFLDYIPENLLKNNFLLT
ncbi:LuxR C-terminal-related transcriptional regulator [Francisella sp. SYW-9]|uniref:LuxR C-terminal-related transcriptional regulator n=1 Tax=Francisella sp. SYW-9 TaxID=2610888 RepID=UPI00123CC598|nr:LuxR C-terminal-related transcriptional regulator [Francisella sp. SYW-9]